MGRLKACLISRSYLPVLLVLIVASSSVAVYFLYPFQTVAVPRVGGGAAIVDTLSERHPNPDFEEEVRRVLGVAGMPVRVYNASSVSVDFMKSFPAGYDLVVFRVHSATSRRGVFYFTSEPYDESKYQPEQYRGELRPARDYEGNPEVFAFGAKFVETYLRDRFRNAIVIGMGCFGAGTSYGTEEELVIREVPVDKGPNLADAFYRQGAIAVIGWDRLVKLDFSDRATLRLIRVLALERLTVKQAVDATNQESGSDPVYRSILVFYPEENGNRIMEIEPSEYVANESKTLRAERLQSPPIRRFCDPILPASRLTSLVVQTSERDSDT